MGMLVVMGGHVGHDGQADMMDGGGVVGLNQPMLGI